MRTLLIQAAVAACSLCLLVPLCWWADFLGDRVNERNYRRVEVGMTERQVEAILGGGQKAHYLWISSGRRPHGVFPGCPDAGGGSHLPVQWYGDLYSVVVWFDEGGLASGKGCWEWSPRWSWESRKAGERALRFLRLENGPPRTLGGGAMFNGMSVGERCRPFVFALPAVASLSAVAVWTLRRHRPGMRKK
jgi:hypothetical protein